MSIVDYIRRHQDSYLKTTGSGVPERMLRCAGGCGGALPGFRRARVQGLRARAGGHGAPPYQRPLLAITQPTPTPTPAY